MQIHFLLFVLVLMGNATAIEVSNAMTLSLEQSAQQRNSSNNPESALPLDLGQIIELIDILPDQAMAGQINKRGINFSLTEATITNLSNRGAGYRTLTVLRSFLLNRPPSVILRIDKTQVLRGQRVSIYAEASDPDGDDLRFQWTSTVGSIKSDGPSAELDTSSIEIRDDDPIKVTLGVTVGDRKGGFASDSHTVLLKSEARLMDDELVGTKAHATIDGKNIEVSLVGISGEPAGSLGSIEVTLGVDRGFPDVRNISGSLPGVACRVDFVGIDNVAEYSFKEPPGVLNRWQKMVVRVRPKDRKRPIRFAVGWKLLKEI